MELKTIFAAGGLVYNDQQELLMIFRRGKWDLPKGKLDEGESLEACALREVQEETGLTSLTGGPLIGITHHEYFDTWLQETVNKETHWYRMHAPGHQPLVPQESEDITAIEWVSQSGIAERLQQSYDTIISIVHQAGLH